MFMNKTCKSCGYNGENFWKDGKYYCEFCGSEIDVTQYDSNTNNDYSSIETPITTEVPITIECPICKNSKNNTLRGGKCHCALCGTSFEFNQPAYNPQDNISPQAAARREELEKQIKDYNKLGIIFLFFCWPASIYFFYKKSQVSKELSNI